MISRGNSLCPIIVCAINQASLARTHVHAHTNLDSSHSNHIIFPDCHILFMPISQIIIKMPTTILSSCLLLMDARLNFFGSPEIFPSAFHSFFFFFFCCNSPCPCSGQMLRGAGQSKSHATVAQKTGVAKTTGPVPLLLSLCSCRSVIDYLHLSSSLHAAHIVFHRQYSQGFSHTNISSILCFSFTQIHTREHA